MQSPTVNGIEIFPFNCTEPLLTLFNIVFATRDRVRFISFVASIGIINTQHKTELFVIELHVDSSFLLPSWNKNGGERPTWPYLPNNHAECRVHYVSQLSRYRALSRTTHLWFGNNGVQGIPKSVARYLWGSEMYCMFKSRVNINLKLA